MTAGKEQAAIELRSEKPSLLLRFLKWVISKRMPVFPHDAERFRDYIDARKPPRDAKLPAHIERQFEIEHWQTAAHHIVTLHPKAGPDKWHMLYFHGGGFVMPMFKEHWPLIAAMVDRLGCSVSVPLYPVVPEGSRAAQDALADAAFAQIAASHDPDRIVLAGDSAGGHMALNLALRAARNGGPRPGRLVLFAPWLDLAMQDEAMREIEPHDIMLKIETLRACGEMFAESGDPAEAEFSPLRVSEGDLAKLPRTRIWTGRHDLFIIDSRNFVHRLIEAGVDAKLYEYEAAPHVFMIATMTREAKDVLMLLEELLED